MELNDMPVFGLMRRRMLWLNQRQEVLAKNIANADTPNFKSRDLKKLDFKEALHSDRNRSNATAISTTNPKHLQSASGDSQRQFKEVDSRRPYETSPDGNQVVLEE
ncbi:MAG: flagellar basal body rod protein FlgB [Rhodospirillales bacterium]|nr:flagellar basal body rod protein FlgB [Rhodospirillales bacterium]